MSKPKTPLPTVVYPDRETVADAIANIDSLTTADVVIGLVSDSPNQLNSYTIGGYVSGRSDLVAGDPPTREYMLPRGIHVDLSPFERDILAKLYDKDGFAIPAVPATPKPDVVNHPTHYAEGWSNGAEVIDITENLPGNRANVVKYVARAGRKNPDTELEDLEKARWYLNREIARIEHGEVNSK